MSELLRGEEGSDFPKAVSKRVFRFPDDHGPHPAFRNEWWYFTGNLDTSSGRRFGYELTIFRFSLGSAAADATRSAWRANQVFIGHFAVSDVAGRGFHVAERYARGAAGLAGASGEPFRVWVDDWSIAETDSAGTWRLTAADEDFSVNFELEPVRPVVLNGDEGLSQKSSEPGNASYYYSISRLDTRGILTLQDADYEVSGLSWLDREWGSSALSRDQQGWDWFALQLSDGSDLMYYTLRGPDGTPDEHSSGTWIEPGGRSVHLARDEVDVAVTDWWINPRGDRYPSGWDISIPGRGVRLAVRPVLEEQELATNVRYWEGAVDVSGVVGGQDVLGRGYVELTGYAEP